MFEQQQNTGKSASWAEKYANAVGQLSDANDRSAHAEHDLQVKRTTRQDLIDEELARRAKLQYCFEICNTALSGYLLFIYALHPFLLFHVIALINKVAPMGDAWYMQTFCYLTAPLACVMVCVGVYWGMRKYMPSVMRVLMGERDDVNKQRKNPNLYCYKLG